MKKTKQFFQLTLLLSIMLTAYLLGNTALTASADATVTSHTPAAMLSSSASELITVTQQPTDRSVAVNGNAVFHVAASGEELSYQWQQLKTAEGSQWVSISTYDGCRTDTLTVFASEGRNGFKYRCLITDKSGNSVYTQEVVMTVLPAVTLTKDTSDVTADIYSTAVFHVEATGGGLTYQWQYYDLTAQNWLPVDPQILGSFSGEATDTFSIKALPQMENKYQVRCLVTDEGNNKKKSSPSWLKISVSSAATISAEDFGASGSDTEDDRKTIQSALKFARDHASEAAPITVTLSSGTFCLSESLVIYSHTRLALFPNTVLSYGGSEGSMLVGGDGTQASYDTLTDVVISGGVWKANASTLGCKTQPIGIKSANNITLTGLKMQDSSDHSIMLTGVNGAVVKDCSFTGFVRVDNGTMYSKEAVHLDFLPFDDGTRFPTKNAAVENCTFDSVASGVGTHNYGNGSYETGITVTGCTFKDVIYNCVNAYCMKDLSVSGCYAENCGSFLRMCDSVGTFTSNIVQGSGPRCYSMLEGSSATVRQCELSGVGSIKEVDDGKPTNVQKTIGLFVLDSGCIIENNELSDILGVGIMVINGNTKSVINGNTISGVTEHGIYFSDAGATGKTIEIADNTLSDCQGILLDYGESLVTGNTLNGCTNGIVVWCGSSQITSNTVSNSTEYGIRVNGTENQKGSADIENNTITGSGSDDLRIEAYCSGCVVKNNNTSGEFRFTCSLRAGIVASGNGIHQLPETPALTCTASGTRIALNWNPCERAVEYIIYSFDPDKQTKKQLAFTKDTQYLIAGLAQNTEYSFLVVCRDESSNYSFYTYPTNVVSAVTGIYEGDPVVLSHPEDIETQDGDTISFSVTADGRDLRYQWYYKKYDAADWTLWKGHDSAFTTALANLSWDGMQVRCEVTDSEGNTAISDPATITVPQPLVIVTQPVSQTVELGNPLTISLQATGSSIQYQWYFMKEGQTSFSEWSGHTRKSETCTPNVTWDGIQLYCVMTDRFGNTDTITVTITQPLAITQQPVSQTVELGSPMKLSVKADGMGLQYQWYCMKAGETSFTEWNEHTKPSETFTPDDPWDGAQLYCVITDRLENTVQSDTVTITIIQQLAITQQPVSRIVELGSPVTVSLKAKGLGLQYQWYCSKAGEASFSPWSEHTNASETFTPAISWDGAQFYCVVTDRSGNTVQSDTITVTISIQLTITQQPVSQTVELGSPMTISVQADGMDLQYQWYCRKAGEAAFALWSEHTNPTETMTPDPSWDGAQLYDTITVTITQPLAITQQPVSQTVELGSPMKLSVKADGMGLQYQWYCMKAGEAAFELWNEHTNATETMTPDKSWDGAQLYCMVTDRLENTAQSDTVTVTITQQLAITQQPVSQTIESGDPMTISVQADGMGLQFQWYFKKNDQTSFSVWNEHTNPTETMTPDKSWDGAQLYCIVTDRLGNTVQSDTVTVTMTQQLGITQQPVSQSVELGSPVTVSLKAQGMGLQYQWYFKKAGQTSFSEWKQHTHSSETCTPSVTWDGIQLYCVVTDRLGNTAQSDTVTVTITQQLAITKQPVSQTAELGSPVTLSVKAQGMGLQYQWYFKKAGQTSFSEWKQHTHSSETCTPGASWNGIQHYCKVKDRTGKTIDSKTIKVLFSDVVTIVTQPADVTAKTGDNVNFTVKAEGVGLTYQWQYKKAGADSWSNWSGRTAASTTAAANATWNGMQIRCVVKNSVGTTVNSNAAKITLSDALAITTQPMSKTINLGDSVTLSLKAQGSGLTYQWYFKKKGQTSFTLWNGRTSATETCTPNATWDGIQLYCKITDGSGKTLHSSTVTVSVLSITAQPDDVTVEAGKDATFTVKATGSALKYQWQYKKSGATAWNNWTGRTAASTTATANSTWNGMQVRCIVTDGAGNTVTSSAATITIQ